MENALRSRIRTSHLGCNGVHINVGERQPKGSHIQRKKLPKGLIQILDKRLINKLKVDRSNCSPNIPNIPNIEHEYNEYMNIIEHEYNVCKCSLLII